MADANMSQRRLGRLQELAQRAVETGRVPGFAALVWRRDELVSVVTEGFADIEKKRPLQRNAIFRIASMTKPIISVAVLMLLEEGRLTLNDPLLRWLPEAADLRVLRNPGAALDDTVPLERLPNLLDLMTHRAGFAAGRQFGPPDAAAAAMAKATGQTTFIEIPPDDFAARVCALPLMEQPGRRWHYGISTDLLGVIIARAAQKPLADFLEERIFGPLGMKDTGFFVPAEKRNRFAIGYARGAKGFTVQDDPAAGHWSKPPVFCSGGGGLVSTLDDYLAFARMLLSGGVSANDERLLSRPTIAMLTAPQLSTEQCRPLLPMLDILGGRNFGLGVSISRGTGPELGSAGKYGWAGIYGTDWFNDPAEELIGIMMSQVWMSSELSPLFANAVYQAIDD